MKDFLVYVVRALVDRPEAVSVNEVEGSRTILGAVSARQGKRAMLEILE